MSLNDSLTCKGNEKWWIEELRIAYRIRNEKRKKCVDPKDLDQIIYNQTGVYNV